jgi:hypothetical protein
MFLNSYVSKSATTKSEDVAKRLKLQANIDTSRLTRTAINIKLSSTEFGL